MTRDDSGSESAKDSASESAHDAAAITFVPASPDHAHLLYAWRQEPVARRFNPFDPVDVDTLATRLQRNCGDLSLRRSSKHRWMAMEGATCVGTVSLQPAWRMQYAEIGYQIGEAHHGRGVGTRVVRALVDMAFAETDLHRVFATIHQYNTASIRIVQRLGFQQEGLLREHYYIAGTHVNEYVYGLLRREWGGSS